MKSKRTKLAKGGKVSVINGAGSPIMASANDKRASFKRGGKPGGTVSGSAPVPRLDKRARGGAVGKTPYSSGKATSSPQNGGPGAGHQNISGTKA